MKTKLILTFVLLAQVVLSQTWATEPYEYNACVEYIYTNYNAQAPMNFVFIQTDSGLEIGRWTLPVPKPTFAQLDAVKVQALAWKSNQVSEAVSDIATMPQQLKCVIRALVKTINLRLPAGQKITEAEMKTAIKAEVQ